MLTKFFSALVGTIAVVFALCVIAVVGVAVAFIGYFLLWGLMGLAVVVFIWFIIWAIVEEFKKPPHYTDDPGP